MVRGQEAAPTEMNEIKRLKITGFCVLAVLSILGTLHSYRGHILLASVSYCIAGIVFTMTMLFPGQFKKATHAIVDFIFAKVLLSVFFFLVITPVGLTMRLFGKDPLDKRIEKDRDSYWIKRDAQAEDISGYEKQF
ncbi:MAG: SxtJ family membrane protein [Candidatus Omnitrophota bacterium]